MFDKYQVDSAQKILGEETWAQIVSTQPDKGLTRVFFEAEKAEYLVSHATTDDDLINVYLTRLTDHRGGSATH